VHLSLLRNHTCYDQPTPNDLRPSQRFAREESGPQRSHHRLNGGHICTSLLQRIGDGHGPGGDGIPIAEFTDGSFDHLEHPFLDEA